MVYSYSTSERNRRVRKVIDKAMVFHLRYQTTILILLSFVFTYYLIKTGLVSVVVEYLGNFGYISAFILGFLFSFGFTTTPAAATLFFLARHINPVGMAFVAAAGGAISNLIIYNFVKHQLLHEVREIFTRDFRIEFAKYEILLTQQILRKRWVKVVVPAVAGILTAMPVPTELIAAILWNIVRYRPQIVVAYTFVFNFIGILILGLFGVNL